MNSQTFSHGDCALVISSCDAYEDLWRPFFFLLDKYWPDWSFPVYLVTEKKQPKIRGVKVLPSNHGPSWSGILQDCVSRIDSYHVVLMLEDFFLRRRVDNERFLQCLEFARSRDCDFLRLCGPPPTTSLPDQRFIGRSEAWQHYRITTQTGIWRRRYLLDMLNPEMNIWQFELEGTKRARRDGSAIYATRKPIVPYRGWFSHHVIEKGKWLPHKALLWQLRGVPIDTRVRGYLPVKQYFVTMSASIFRRTIRLLPAPTYERVRIFFRRLLSPVFGAYYGTSNDN